MRWHGAGRPWCRAQPVSPAAASAPSADRAGHSASADRPDNAGGRAGTRRATGPGGGERGRDRGPRRAMELTGFIRRALMSALVPNRAADWQE